MEKKFGLPPPLAMAIKDPAGKNSDLAQRLRAVMLAEGIPTQDAFAAKLGVDKKRLNNPMVGYTLSVDLAMRIRNAIPGMTRDWLYEGDETGLPVGLRDRLRDAATKLKAAAGRSVAV